MSVELTIEQRIDKALDRIRPSLRLDGGGIEFVKFDTSTGAVHVKMQGACVGCPMSEITLKMGVESVLQDEIPEVQEVIAEE
tara:strand:+ start:15 stop:260 length:246 start_codon:yes stop_codon:yes gene_type:complete